MHETTTCTPVGFSVGSVGFPVDFTRSTASERHFHRLQPVAAHAPLRRSPTYGAANNIRQVSTFSGKDNVCLQLTVDSFFVSTNAENV